MQLSAAMTDSGAHPIDGDFDPAGLPLLRLNPWEVDWEAFRTWHEAVSGFLSPWLPHDLFALWLLPAGRPPVLVGPEALAQDNLVIPRAEPYLAEASLAEVEKRVQRAYPSVMMMPVRHGAMDVGLLLTADLRYGLYGERERNILHEVTRQIGPMMARVARRWDEVHFSPDDPGHENRDGGEPETPASRLVELFTELGQAATESATPRAYVKSLRDALAPLIPHDHIELLIPDNSGDQWYQLGEHDSGQLWSNASLIVNRSHMDPPRIFEDSDRFISHDTALDGRGPIWPVQTFNRAGGGLRSAIGIELRVLDRTTGYLFLGCHGRSFYALSDLDLLARVADLVAPRVDGFVLLWQRHVLRGQLTMLKKAPEHMGALNQLLATTGTLGEATRLFSTEARKSLSFDRMTFALRTGVGDRVRVFESGDERELPQLPEEDWAERFASEVLRGELPYALESDEAGGSSGVTVPLRSSNTILGALVVVRGSGSYGRAEAAMAQQLADIIAPYLELLRRSVVDSPLESRWQDS